MSDQEEYFAGGETTTNTEVKSNVEVDLTDWSTQKIQIIAWKAVTGTLATPQGKVVRRRSSWATCSICGMEDEGSFHALVTCNHSQRLWEKMSFVWPLPARYVLWDTGMDWLLQVLALCSEVARNMAIILVWRIWQVHTDMSHVKEDTPVEAWLTSFRVTLTPYVPTEDILLMI